MTKIIYLGGNRITDKDLTVGKVYEQIDSDYSDSVRVHDDIWDIHSITDNAYREVIEQSINVGDTVAVTSECTSKDLVGKIGKVIEAIDDFGTMCFKVQFENPINTEEWGEVKNIVLRDNRFVLVEQASKPVPKYLEIGSKHKFIGERDFFVRVGDIVKIEKIDKTDNDAPYLVVNEKGFVRWVSHDELEPFKEGLTDEELKELGELLSNITKYEDAYNFSKKRYKESKQRIKELKQKGGLS